MSTRYYATHPSLLGDITWQALKQQVKDAKLERKIDNGIEFTTNKPSWQLKEIPFLQNIFVVAETFNSKLNVKGLTEQVNKSQTLTHLIKKHTNLHDTFRVVLAKGTHTNQLPEGFRIAIEENTKRYAKRGVSRTTPKFEIWLWQLEEDYTILALRITQNADYQDYMPAGGLRQELAYLMNYLAKPTDLDTVWDPFAGSGSLVISRALHFPYKQIYASDISKAKIEGFISKQKLKLRNFHIQEADLFSGAYVPTVDVVITDPPWSIFANPDKTKNLIRLTTKALRPEGRAIILASVSLDDYTDDIINVTSQPTFVGGRQAYINILVKNS